MKKRFSLIFLLSVGLCTAITFATSKFKTGVDNIDKFGFPFVFFSANDTGEIVQNNYFNPSALLFDYAICFLICFTIVTLIALLKVEKKNTPLVL